jgi:hypothetical protein
VVTNGDNLYDPSFLGRLLSEAAEGGGADAVAFDYYSRFLRPTGQRLTTCVARIHM